MALKASRKPIKLVGWHGHTLRRLAVPFNPDHNTSTRPGYVIDDGPRNEAPRDADCGVARRGLDRPDRDVVVPQPGRVARSGRGADPRRHRARSRRQRPIDVSVFPGSYVSFHDVGLKGGGTTDPALQVDVLTANLRLLPLLLRRFEIADVMMLRPHIRVVRDGRWREQLDAVRRDHRAHHEARRREPGVVFGNPDPGRRAQL